jgi:thioredoxin-related protein
MRTPLTLIALFLLIAAVALSLTVGDSPEAAESELSWKSFDEGANLAVQQKKKMLVDIYTDWCGWCKKMDKEVYPDAKVKSVLESKFVVVKLNAESDNKIRYQGSSMSQREFARAVGVTGYPATLFFDENLKPITLLPGYVKADNFAQILAFIGENHYKNKSYQNYLNSLSSLK